MRSEHASHWPLDPDVVFLNHGSFGACPTVVLEAQRELRARLESQPLRFFLREYPALLQAALEDVGAFVGADASDVVFVNNATTGVNTVLRSVQLAPGDEVLLTDQAYGACRLAAEHVANRRGARVAVARIPFPVESEADVVRAVTSAVTDRTRLALLDHVTSPTGLVLPIERLVADLQDRGVDVLVDGAHALGMVPLSLDELGAAYYVANCHKWVCSPKGAAILHVRRDLQKRLRPLVISHGAGIHAPPPGPSAFQLEMGWTGTGDPTAWLAVPAALRFLRDLLPGGWTALRARNRTLALEARGWLGEALCPDSMVGWMAAAALPDTDEEPPSAFGTDPLQDRLLTEHGIEVPIIRFPAPSGRLVRLSVHAYNHRSEYETLAQALEAVLPSGAP